MKHTIIRIILFILLTTFPFQLGFTKEDPNFNILFETYGIVKTQYVEKDTNDQTLIYGAIKGLLESLDDQYTRFLEPTANSEMKIRLDGEFYGVGIQIGIKDKQLTVIAPIEDTPAFKAGIKAKDKIIKIDGKDTKGISLTEAVSKIRGEKGTKVVLTVLRPTNDPPKEMDIPIIRDTIKLKSITNAKTITSNIGYFRISTFESKQMIKEMTKVIKNFQKEKMLGLIIDVRDNGGGLLYNAIMASSFFLENGKDIVHTVGRNRKLETKRAVNINPKYKKPIIVIVNGNSASASEIFAGAISDNGRGIVMGSKTFGKASVQNIRELTDGSAVLITIAKYLTPTERDISKVGIAPDLEVKIPTKNLEEIKSPDYIYTEETDFVLQEAIQVMKEIIY